MPLYDGLNKVMVIGSGPIVIGQAAEFDYSGSQACRALKEEGLEVVLLNSNPATIMTDRQTADRVYIEPTTVEYAARILARERPDALLPMLGGQTALNIAVELADQGVLSDLNVRLLGTSPDTIRRAEDRQLFKDTMESIGEPVPFSGVATSVDAAREIAAQANLPVIIRPAYTLGGVGGGTATTWPELDSIVSRGLHASPIGQVLVEQSLLGFKEIEYEVMRDRRDNSVVICTMENIDPMGIHTGDSIVVAPTQTLTNEEQMRLRSAAINIVRSLNIEGGCNVQFAVDPRSDQYYVIEVNPRVSRSSALASKATGYPIAKVASQVAIGLCLDEIGNPVTGSTTACYEPAIDYLVVKIPRWPFDKFLVADRRLGTQMKATGEVMAIDRTLPGALNKALRSLELDNDCLWLEELAEWTEAELVEVLSLADDRRIFVLAEALRRGTSGERICELTGIDPLFVNVIADLVGLERHLQEQGMGVDLVRQAKQWGYSDSLIGRLVGQSEDQVRAFREERELSPTFKMVDTCAGEFEATTPYFYSCYDREDEMPDGDDDQVMVIGSGPIRIGQGIEFDYCCVHTIMALQAAGRRAVMINCNPETVSTDFDIADRLLFEPLTGEDVLTAARRQGRGGVIVQSGGQTAVNLAGYLARRGIRILGTSPESIDLAEDRELFDRLLSELGIPRPPGAAVTSLSQAKALADRIDFPLVVRPSYVLGGRAMEIVYNIDELTEYLERATKASHNNPVLVDRYVRGVEVEVDAVADGSDVLIVGIMEHLERAGIHSGDSIAVYPARSLSPSIVGQITYSTVQLARALGTRGFLNIQFVIHEGRALVLEVNPRASRTMPFLAKVTGTPMIELATRVMLGERLSRLGQVGLVSEPGHVAVKMPVFSWSRLFSADTLLGPEMKSTGEVMGLAPGYDEALARAFVSAGFSLPDQGTVAITVADRDKPEMKGAAETLARLGYRLVATAGTARYLSDAGLAVEPVSRIGQGSPTIPELIAGGYVDLVLNTHTRGRKPERDGFRIRSTAAEHGVPCFTSSDTALAAVRSLEYVRGHRDPAVRALTDYLPGD